MADIQEDRLDEQVYRDEGWITQIGGGWLHANNVLFYFMQSPFFDRTSNNQSLFTQAQYDQSLGSIISNRQSFEARLREMGGLEFVVEHDPLQASVRIPTAKENETDWSNVWTIKKQNRRKRPGQPDEVEVLAFYYIVNNGIYVAPPIGKVVGNRMLSTMTALDKLLSEVVPLANFSPARGHTYLPPSTKPTGTGLLSARASKDSTPLPDAALSKSATESIGAVADNSSEAQNLKTLTEAFTLAHRYGQEYMDDAPLTGEPGNFVLSKSRDSGGLLSIQQTSHPTTKSPFESNVSKDKPGSTSSLPSLDTDIAKAKRAVTKNGEQSAVSTPTSAKDKKRKKSKSAASPTG